MNESYNGTSMIYAGHLRSLVITADNFSETNTGIC